LFSSHLGASASWLWVCDRERLSLVALPARSAISGLLENVLRGVREDQGAHEANGRLYDVLFAGVEQRVLDKPRWLLSLDESLFQVPFAALVERKGASWAYIADGHATEVIPGAAVLASQPRRRKLLPGAFLGIGDPIYNRADPRLPKARRQLAGGWNPTLLLAGSQDLLALPRLVASAGEIESSAGAWASGKTTLLTGAAANRERLQEGVEQCPAVVHLATHVLESSQEAAHGLIALSMGASGQPELLTPFEIARWRAGPSLVVMSGCSSAAGAALRGTGLIGLTRAWLAAGASAVVASRWSTPDDDGTFFLSFYQHLRSDMEGGASLALRRAQRDMIHHGGWRASPRYWGAFFVTGNP
jgi:CHAT domain-containing protein